MIKVKNLTKKFDYTVAVDNINFEVKRGEVVGFLGPNGAGKTTTMRILTCFLLPTSGTARVAGYDIIENPIEVRRHLGYVPENAPLYEEMTVREYLGFVADMRGIPGPRRKKAINEKIEICSLERVMLKNIGELSKGYKQRVCLAQALLHDPELLVLDEPTSGLDPSQIIEIRDLIKQLGKEKTVILSTHILSEVSATCDRVLIINEGRLTASGTQAELQDAVGGYKNIYLRIRADYRDVESKLSSFSEIREVKRNRLKEKDLWEYCLKTDKDAHINEKLFRWVVDNGWSLTELREETLSLEDVFLALTSGEERRGEQ